MKCYSFWPERLMWKKHKKYTDKLTHRRSKGQEQGVSGVWCQDNQWLPHSHTGWSIHSSTGSPSRDREQWGNTSAPDRCLSPLVLTGTLLVRLLIPNVTVYLILPWVLVSRKALFCPEALTPVSKHLPHLGYQGLSACQWNNSRYQIKAAWLHFTSLPWPVDGDTGCLAVPVPPCPPSLLGNLPQIPGQFWGMKQCVNQKWRKFPSKFPSTNLAYVSSCCPSIVNYLLSIVCQISNYHYLTLS